MNDIVYQNKDIASKVTGESLIGRSLSPFGRPDLKIVAVLPTNLPAIESNELRLDNLFLLSDGSLAIIDYESDFRMDNFVKYLNYIARIVKRYALRKQLPDLKEIRVIVIYTADVEHAKDTYELVSITLRIEPVYLVNQNSNHIYQKLRSKIECGETLTEEELTELMILPLTAKGKERKQHYIEKAVQLAKKLPKQSDTFVVLSGLLTFTDKIIDKDYAQRLTEEFYMLTQVEQLLYERCWERAKKEAAKQAEELVTKQAKELAQIQAKELAEAKIKEFTETTFLENTASLLAETYQELNLPKEKAITKLAAKTGLTHEDAVKYLNKHWYH